jgi:hypothetical protein
MSHRLDVYLADCCYGCAEARALADNISTQFPSLQVEIFDLDDPDIERPASVFAVPTFLLDGELLWLGNPRREDAVTELAHYLADRQG